jgi:hypothetical protein
LANHSSTVFANVLIGTRAEKPKASNRIHKDHREKKY